MKFRNLLLKMIPTQIAFAHCDVPCGIYSPDDAKQAAATVLKMTQKLKEYPESDLNMDTSLAALNSKVRAILTKEEHAGICKTQLLILWTDYFKPEHFEKFPDLTDQILNACKLCSKAKQSADEDVAQELVAAVDEIADIFNQTKAA